jgi:hypothetical protein
MSEQPKIKISSCPIDYLLLLPGVGRLTADRIMSLRQQYDNINASDLIEIPRLKLTRQLLDMIDFSPVGPEPTAYPACIQCDVEVQTIMIMETLRHRKLHCNTNIPRKQM